MTRYRATVSPPGWLLLVFWAVFALAVVISGLLWWTQGGEYPVVCAVGTALLLGSTGPFVGYRGRITVDDEVLRLRAVPFGRASVPVRDVVSVEPTEVALWRDVTRIGCRVDGDTVWFVFRSGPAARVRARDGRTYVVVAPDADRLVAALRTRVPHRA